MAIIPIAQIIVKNVNAEASSTPAIGMLAFATKIQDATERDRLDT